MTATANGRMPRKTLSSQLDRLDNILDGFSNSLDDAVQDAVKAAVREAVAAAVVEVLTNHDLQARLRTTLDERQVPPQPSRLATAWTWLVSSTKRLWSAATAKAKQWLAQGREKVQGAYSQAAGRVKLAWMWTRVLLALAGRFRRSLVQATVAGLLVGLGCYMAGPAMAAAVSGLSGFTLSLLGNGIALVRGSRWRDVTSS